MVKSRLPTVIVSSPWDAPEPVVYFTPNSWFGIFCDATDALPCPKNVCNAPFPISGDV